MHDTKRALSPAPAPQRHGESPAANGLSPGRGWKNALPRHQAQELRRSLPCGKRLPGSFRLVLQLPRRELEHFLARAQLGLRPEQVQGLYLNIRYEEGMLRCVTGTALNFFTMDKSLETEWDGYVRRFFQEHGIPCREE